MEMLEIYQADFAQIGGKLGLTLLEGIYPNAVYRMSIFYYAWSMSKVCVGCGGCKPILVFSFDQAEQLENEYESGIEMLKINK